MQSKKIKDSAIKTGEDAVTSGKEGYYARLNNEKSWCIPNIPGYTGPGEFKSNMYIEVTFSGSHQISAMALQGEGDNSYGKYIRVSYDYAGFFHFYKIDGKTEVSFFLRFIMLSSFVFEIKYNFLVQQILKENSEKVVKKINLIS